VSNTVVLVDVTEAVEPLALGSGTHAPLSHRNAPRQSPSEAQECKQMPDGGSATPAHADANAFDIERTHV
jgi:hypothetical protein